MIGQNELLFEFSVYSNEIVTQFWMIEPDKTELTNDRARDWSKPGTTELGNGWACKWMNPGFLACIRFHGMPSIAVHRPEHVRVDRGETAVTSVLKSHEVLCNLLKSCEISWSLPKSFWRLEALKSAVSLLVFNIFWNPVKSYVVYSHEVLQSLWNLISLKKSNEIAWNLEVHYFCLVVD